MQQQHMQSIHNFGLINSELLANEGAESAPSATLIAESMTKYGMM